jgi:hypothetical protein
MVDIVYSYLSMITADLYFNYIVISKDNVILSRPLNRNEAIELSKLYKGSKIALALDYKLYNDKYNNINIKETKE